MYAEHCQFEPDTIIDVVPMYDNMKIKYGAKYVVMQYALRLYSPKMHLCGNLNITFHFLFLVHWI